MSTQKLNHRHSSPLYNWLYWALALTVLLSIYDLARVDFHLSALPGAIFRITIYVVIVILISVNRNPAKKSVVKFDDNGKPRIGGWLLVILIWASFGAVINLYLSISSLIAHTSGFAAYLAISNFFAFIAIVLLLSFRKKFVKYALATHEIIPIVFGIIALITGVSFSVEIPTFLMNSIRIIILTVIAVLKIKIYFKYINNFDRPKQTLTN